jgi:hypothetical protein
MSTPIQISIANTCNKLNADYFFHLGSYPSKVFNDITSEVILVKSDDGQEFEAKIIDFWKGPLEEVPEMLMLASLDMERLDAHKKFGRTSLVGLYLFKKVI